MLLLTAGLLATLFEGHLATAEEIYKVVDEEGNATFADTPPSDANAIVEPHSILVTNTTLAVATASTNVDKAGRPNALAPFVTRIVYQASESTISMGPGHFSGEAEVSPRLGSGAQLIFLLDDEAVNTPQITQTATNQRVSWDPPIAGHARQRDGSGEEPIHWAYGLCHATHCKRVK